MSLTGTTHTITAAAAAYWLSSSMGMPAADTYVAAISAASGALVPDFDVFWSGMAKKMSDKFSEAAILMFPGLIALTVIALITGWRKHRTLTHSLLGLALFTLGMLIALLISTFYTTDRQFQRWVFIWVISGICGYVLHLIEDSFTVSGIPIFFPWSNKNYGLLPERYRLKTGSWVEKVFIALSGLILSSQLFRH